MPERRPLPYVDVHCTDAQAPPGATWDAVAEVARRSLAGARSATTARALGCTERRAGGDWPEAGATVPGFRVVEADRPHRLVLRGRHRFSRYELAFTVAALPGGRSRVWAETRAEFPGAAGRAYRALVIGSRGHVLVVRRLLGVAARRAARTRHHAAP